ncbi:MAG: phenylacetate--CoA ligase family protein [Pseudomonadota bacterium]
MSHYFAHLEIEQLLKDYPIGHEFVQAYGRMSRDELRNKQEERFLRVMARAWDIPFYRRRWQGVGLEPGDIRGLDDITKLPVYDKADIMESIEAYPPFGDFTGWSRDPRSAVVPVTFHTTSGTTGKPQILLFGPKGREVGNLLAARMYQWQGLTSGDVVHSVYGHGTINGGHYIREAVTHFTSALFVPAGTGAETRSARQVELMRDFGATVLVGFVDYLRKLSNTAHELGIVPGEDIKIRMISGHLGMEDRSLVEDDWGGAKVYDWYGVADTGSIAGEGPDRDGLYIWEDAHFLELLDIEDGRPVAPGEKGDMVCTCLYKDDIFPVIRFNTHDVSAAKLGSNATGMVFERIEGFLGRSDNMVKLRGINVFPHAVGQILADEQAFNGAFVCFIDRDQTGRDEMTVMVEIKDQASGSFHADLSEKLKLGLGVSVLVEHVPEGATAVFTEIDRRQKPLRLIDRRGR